MTDADFARLKALIAGHRLPLNDEKQTQAKIADLLTADGWTYYREHRLAGSDIPDFLVGDAVIEVKLRARRMDIYRQLERYAAHPSVDRLLLVTCTSMHLPDRINDKPAAVVSLSRAWL